MKLWRIAVLLVIITTGCSAATGSTPTQPASNAAQTLPTPMVLTTRVPNPESAAKAFLDSWKAEDYPKMYSLLTPISKDAISSGRLQ